MAVLIESRGHLIGGHRAKQLYLHQEKLLNINYTATRVPKITKLSFDSFDRCVQNYNLKCDCNDLASFSAFITLEESILSSSTLSNLGSVWFWSLS